ncbi:MAG TPA: type II secretion system F family protein [Stellaceae bacterium]|nr:type II secretion system F family protein [Stellaceae bacterium]
MSDLSAAFLFGVAAITFGFAGLCIVAHNVSLRREQLRGRVDLLAFGRRAVARATGRSRTAEPASLLTSSILHGEQLEFARFLTKLRLPTTYAPQVFLVVRLVVAVALAAILPLLAYRYGGVRKPALLALAALFGALLGVYVPQKMASRSATNRKRAISRGLPDAIELLVIAVEAGLSLEDAMNRIVGELRASQPEVAEELAITGADLRMLPNREDALRRLADRLDMPSVSSVVSTLSQTLKYGTPLAQALRVVSAELRNDALVRLEEQANRMPVLLTIPMILFILPSLFLVIGGPAFLTVLDVFSRWHH